MEKSTLRRIDAAARERRRRPVPAHPTVNVEETWVRALVRPAVARQLLVLAEQAKRASVARNLLDASLNFLAATFAVVMQRVGALRGQLEVADRVADGATGAGALNEVDLAV